MRVHTATSRDQVRKEACLDKRERQDSNFIRILLVKDSEQFILSVISVPTQHLRFMSLEQEGCWRMSWEDVLSSRRDELLPLRVQ